MKQISIWMALAAIACGVALAQKTEAGNVFFFADHKEKLNAEMVASGIGTAQFGLIGPVVKGAPYTAESVTEHTQTLGDGTRINRNESHTIYRDGEGRVRRESGDEAWISDPVANVSWVLNTKLQTARKMPLSHTFGYARMQTVKITTDGNATLGMPGPDFNHSVAGPVTVWKSSQAEKSESLGKQEMEGVEVEGTRNTSEIPVGQIGNDRPLTMIHERWESPELHVTVLEKHTDPMMGNMEERLTSIRRGEPDPSMFQVPAGYQVESAK